MRKRGNIRTIRPATPPMLVSRGLQNDSLETRERMFVEAFAGGWATTEHFDQLADMRDCLLLAAASKGDAETIGMCRAAGIVLMNVRDRYAATQRMGVTGEELQALRLFATTYRDFWLRQSVGAYESACDALSRARAMNQLEVEVRR
ncbi:hypothetical protein [Propionivibrio limicola]|uniref:hypothetical protein n=1 Tax=Propionivibrio limicola TaxID=167645 RepID=UPI001292284A|nr:hypothetical protein [Propionivibrio limicola]